MMTARASFLSRGIAIGTIAACAAIAGWGGNPGADSIEGRSLLAVAITSAYLAFCAAVALRHQRRRHAQERMWMSGEDSAAADASAPAKGEAILIAFASQTGFAEQLAMQTAQSLRAGQNGKSSVRVLPLGRIDESQLASFARALFIVSTTGEGDAPDGAAGFARRMARIDAQAAFPGLKFGILALGDRSYANYCAFGHALEGWLRRHHALPLFDTIEVDNGEEGALRHWQHQLGVLSGQADMPDWIAPAYGRWRLIERRLLNPGSVGGPVFHLGLAPLEYPQPRWQAGDIAEVGPRDPVDVSKHLPHREYSIASLPEHGTLDLVVRRVSHPDGRLGIGSGWLTQYTEIGDEIALRVRGNSNFHQPEDDRPLILIGNGTGLAGLRAHMQARIAAGRDRNWLVFGERSRAVDYLYRDEIEGWLESGRLQRLDLAFSRDQTQRIYVQDRLRESAAELRIWVEQGAAIYVCGSLLGMADGVAAALNDVLGENRLITLAEEGRYRRDVY